MKLEPIFSVKENKLVKIADNTTVDFNSLKKVTVKWSEVEMEPEAYNEEYLANLRDTLKGYDEAGIFAVIIPEADKLLNTPEEFELFINAFNHTARRIKDCISVAGMDLPEEILKNGVEADSPAISFMETLAVKHAQYVYFAAETTVSKLKLDNKIQNLAIVTY